MSLLRILLVCFLSSLFIACGGGGGSSSGGGNSAPVASAGADVSVTGGERVSLQGSGSDKDGDSLTYSWKQVSGEPVSLTSYSFQGDASFLAPINKNDYTLKFSLTVTDSKGASSSDEVVVTVTGVNQVPVANAGEDVIVDGLETVALSGSGSDADGTIETYSWTQVSGEPVTITSADQKNASFTAPSTMEELTLSFRLTVTDDSGATAEDGVNITVLPENAPDVAVHFPQTDTGYAGTEIDIFGQVSVRNAEGEDKSITSVTVDLGSGPVEATVNADGTWRATNVAVPSGVTDYMLEVIALDSVGLSRSSTIEFSALESNVGEGNSWYQSTAVVLDREDNKAYVLSKGNFVSDIKLFSVDLATGDRSGNISPFSNSAYGPTFVGGFNDMVLDKPNNRVFISAAPASGDAAIFTVDLETGNRVIISDDSTDTVVGMQNPVGLELAADGTLWVADNTAGSILAVDTETGARTVVADSGTPDVGMTVPLYLTYNDGDNSLYVSPYITDDPLLISVDLSNSNTTAIFSQNSTSNGPDLSPLTQGLVADSANNRLLVMNGGDDNLLSIDLTTGDRTLIAAGVTGSYTGTESGSVVNSKDVTYDSETQLLYVVGGEGDVAKEALFTIDPVSGDKVVRSR